MAVSSRILPPIVAAFGYESSFAHGINDKGQVAGTLGKFFEGAYMGMRNRAVLWGGDRVRDLGTLPPCPDSSARAVNDNGGVAGTALFSSSIPAIDNPASQAPHAFLYRGGRMTDLGPGEATGINNKGQVAGYLVTDAGANGEPLGVITTPATRKRNNAFLWQNGRRVDLGAGAARGINDKAQVVGTAPDTGGGTRAFLWENGKRRDLGQGEAMDINDRSQIVGQRLGRATLWQNGESYDLNRYAKAAGWVLQRADAVNERGQIIGNGTFKGKQRAFLLTPK